MGAYNIVSFFFKILPHYIFFKSYLYNIFLTFVDWSLPSVLEHSHPLSVCMVPLYYFLTLVYNYIYISLSDSPYFLIILLYFLIPCLCAALWVIDLALPFHSLVLCLVEEIATHPSSPAWRIPGREESGELQSMESQRDLATRQQQQQRRRLHNLYSFKY